VFAVLPLPWRLIPVSLIFALALMNRVSFEMGAAFFLVSAFAAVISGLAPGAVLIIAAVCMAAAYGLSTRVFARRSVVAFSGLALATGLIYFMLRFGILSPVHGFFPWMYLFLATMTAMLAVMASLALEWALSGFGKRFVTKDQTYEVRTDR
jgi:hypothetical protein